MLLSLRQRACGGYLDINQAALISSVLSTNERLKITLICVFEHVLCVLCPAGNAIALKGYYIIIVKFLMFLFCTMIFL